MEKSPMLSRFHGALQLLLTADSVHSVGACRSSLSTSTHMAEHSFTNANESPQHGSYLRLPTSHLAETRISPKRESFSTNIPATHPTNVESPVQFDAHDDSQSSQGSNNSRLSQIVQSAGHTLISTFRSISIGLPEDEVKYPDLPSRQAMPGTFPASPMKSGPRLEQMEVEPGDELDQEEEIASGRAPYTFHQPDLSMLDQHGTNLAIFSPTFTPRKGFERAGSPTPYDIRARKRTERSGPPSVVTDDSYIDVEAGSIASTTHAYPPRVHRTFVPSPAESSRSRADNLNRVGTSAEAPRHHNQVNTSTLPTATPVANPFGIPGTSNGYDVEFEAPTRPVTPEASETRAGPAHPVISSLPASVRARNPIILAHAPRHQQLWNRLPVGTLFELVRISRANGIDLEHVDAQALTGLCASNKETMHMVSSALGCHQPEATNPAFNQQRNQVADELDWEAEQIVKGTGQLLGWQEEKGTPYGGKVQFAASLKFREVPKVASMEKMQSKLELDGYTHLDLEPPRTRGSCIFSRVHGSHRILRVRISGQITRTVSVWAGTAEQRRINRDELQLWAQRPIFILGRVYTPLVEKDGVLVYFLEGRDFVGEFFDRGSANYGIKECQTLQQFLDWWIPFRTNGQQPISKLVARLHLGLSDTLPGFLIHPRHITIREDIKNNGNEFTDGAGIMTPSVALALTRKYQGIKDTEISLAFQIRIQTAKGVILVDPKLLHDRNFSTPHKLTLYRSMCKAKKGNREYRPGPVNGLHILDASDCMLCVVKPAPSSSSEGARLSSQFITILSGNGVPDAVFLRLQRQSIEAKLKVWTEVSFEGPPGFKVIDRETRLRLVREIGKTQSLALAVKRREVGGSARGLGYGRNVDLDEEQEESFDENQHPTGAPGVIQRLDTLASMVTDSGNVERPLAPFSHNEISGFPGLKAEALQLALAANIDVIRSNYWFKIWNDIAKSAMMNILSKFHLAVERSASGFFQPDPTGRLREGEIFFVPKERMVDSETGLLIDKVEGDVIVGRHPALLPTDMQKVKAVWVPDLQSYRGIIFCSVHGSISLAGLCAGGDYDGDEGTIIWEPSIVNNFQNAPPDLRHEPAAFAGRFKKEEQAVEVLHATTHRLPEHEWKQQVTQKLVASIGEGDTFKIYNSFWNKSVYQHGLQSETTRIIAHSFNYLMDAKKTGHAIVDHILTKDKTHWSVYDDPYWFIQQKNHESTENIQRSASNLKSLRPFQGRNILDNLMRDGEAQLNHAITQLQTTLRPTDPSSELSYDGAGKDQDLMRPWLKAQEAANRNPELKPLLRGVEDMVKECHQRLKHANKEFTTKRISGNGRSQQIREICRDFCDYLAQDDAPFLVSSIDYDNRSLRWLKASYAYALDMGLSNRGGGVNGFPWILAMRDLCDIKASATSQYDTVTIPHEVWERMEIHRYWGS